MMAARRIAVQNARCPSCSVSLLNSLFGTQFRLPAVASRTISNAGRFRASVPSERTFHRSAVRLNINERTNDTNEILVESATPRTEAIIEELSEPGVEIVEEEFQRPTTEIITESSTEIFGNQEQEQESSLSSKETTSQPTPEAVPEKSVPWFLRVETPRPASHPFADRQILPEIPSDAPPALEPLLKHLSEELGINDLSLIDLRAMDPPPAIGADTIMIVGNARSERHLHISADKTCRWLRSEWKMAPYADGLLGRNEVKIKNRRLKKRGKLVSTQTGEVEGVGWICVDVGSQGLVVQLFTKHRRGEIDLEGLWGKYLGKGATIKKAVSIEDLFKQKKPVENVDIKYTPPVPMVRLGVGLSAGSGFSNTQRRSFHTTPNRLQKKQKQKKAFHIALRRRRAALGTQEPKHTREIGALEVLEGIEFRGIDILRCVERGQYWQFLKQLPPSYEPAKYTIIPDLILKAQINHLKLAYVEPNEPTHTYFTRNREQCNVIGNGPEDTASTEFLRAFHYNLTSSIPALKKFRFRLSLLIEAHRINPKVYPNSCFLAHLNRMVSENLPIEPEIYYLALRAICNSPQRLLEPLKWEESSTKLLDVMNEITKHMETHCTRPDISVPEIQYTFFRAVAPPNLDIVQKVAATICSQELADTNKPINHVLIKYPTLHVGTYTLDSRLYTTDVNLSQANYPYTLREYQEALLTVYAMAGAWVAFWNRWKRLRYMVVHRDVGFYSLVVGLLVMGRNQRECVLAARWLPKDMVRETPGVGLTVGLARGMLRLVEIAEGGLRVGVVKEEIGMRNWLNQLRERCEGVIERVGRKREAEKLLA